MTDSRTLCRLLRGHRYNTVAEEELQRGIAAALDGAGIAHRREVTLAGDVGRVDFLVEGVTAVEVKIAGRVSDVIAQLERYAGCSTVQAVVLATTRASHVELHGLQVGRHVISVALLGGAL